ncbi:MAG: hypothetical protein HRT64_11115 [Erythrobacter sp.]|nr:hypothetical protein [Erythrobacter sp.]
MDWKGEPIIIAEADVFATVCRVEEVAPLDDFLAMIRTERPKDTVLASAMSALLNGAETPQECWSEITSHARKGNMQYRWSLVSGFAELIMGVVPPVPDVPLEGADEGERQAAT